MNDDKESSNAVVILGAGATRGVSSLRRPIVPPLDADFFQQLMRFPRGQHDCVDRVLRDLPNLCGSAHRTTLEQYFSLLEALPEVVDISPHPRFKSKTRRANAERLTRAVAVLLNEALAGSNGQHLDCKYHTAMVNALRSGDSILTFNYDCTIDWSLKLSGKAKWNPTTGYGIRAVNGASWVTDRQVSDDSPVKLFKMHGSLHFKHIDRDLLTLWSGPFRQDGEEFKIIPPIMSKRLDDGYKQIWSSAASALAQTRRLCIIGYSLPASDLTALALLLCNVGRVDLDVLTIVNPSREVSDRLYSVLSVAIGPDTRVVFNHDFAEFADQGCPGLGGR